MKKGKNSPARLVAQLFTLAGTIFGGVKYYTFEVEENLRRIMSEAKQKVAIYGELNYQQVEFSLLRREFSVIGLSFKPQAMDSAIELRKASFDQFSYKDLALIVLEKQKQFNEGRFQFVGLKMDTQKMDPQAVVFFKDMGLTTVYGNFTTSFKMIPETNNIHLREISFELQGLAKISFELKIDQFKLPSEQQWQKLGLAKGSPMEIMNFLAEAELDKAALEKLEIKYQDFSLLSRVRYSMYKQNQTDIYQMASTSRYVNPLAGRVPASEPAGNKMDVILKTFLKDPKVISFSMVPTQRVTFGEMLGKAFLNPKGLIDSLNPQWNVNGQVFEGI